MKKIILLILVVAFISAGCGASKAIYKDGDALVEVENGGTAIVTTNAG